MFQYNQITSLSELDEFQDEWRGLCDRALDGASLFRSFEWYQAVLTRYENILQPRALAIYLAGRPVGIMPLVEQKSGQNIILRMVPTLWPSPMLPVGPNLAAVFTGTAKFVNSLCDFDLYEVGPIDRPGLDQGRAETSFRIVGQRPVTRKSWTQHIIDLTTVENAESRLCRELTKHQFRFGKELPSITLHRYRSGEATSLTSKLIRRLNSAYPDDWSEARRSHLVSLIEMLDSQNLLDATIVSQSGKLISLLIAHSTEFGMEGGLFLSTSDTGVDLLIGELMKDGLSRGHQNYRLSSYSSSDNASLLPWASRLTVPTTYQQSVLFSKTGLGSRWNALWGKPLGHQEPIPSIDEIDLTVPVRETIPLRPHTPATSALRLFTPRR